MNDIRNTIIIGSGPAGLTAALYAARANLRPLVIDGSEPGGQLMTTTDVENYPGFPEGIQGPELIDRMRRQAARFGTEYVSGDVTKIDLSQRPFVVTVGDQEFLTKTVIIATGARPRKLGLASEERLAGKGVSYCATCDGFFFKGKELAVVGGGDAALEEATFLTKFATKVTVLVRTEKLRASRIMQDRAKTNDKITFVYNKVVDEVLGDKSVSGLRLKDTVSGEASELAVGGLFVAIGHEPNTAPFKDAITLGKQNYLVLGEPSRSLTNIEGVFAGGDVHDHLYRQAVTAAGYGCRAAIDVERYLSQLEAKE